MMRHTDHDAAKNVDRRDDQTCDGVAAHEFRGPVHRAEERALLFELTAPPLGFLVID